MLKSIGIPAIILSVMGCGEAVAANLVFTFSGKLQLFPIQPNPSDAAGLVGATFTFSATFNNGTTWINDGTGFPFAQASSSSITIAGASQTLSNGTRTPVTGVGMASYSGGGAEGLWIDNPTNYNFPFVNGLAGGQSLIMGLSLTPGAIQPTIGGGVSTANFGTFNANNTTFQTSNNTVYNINLSQPFITTVTGGPTVPVPEPSAFGILAIVGYFLRRNWR